MQKEGQPTSQPNSSEISPKSGSRRDIVAREMARRAAAGGKEGAKKVPDAPKEGKKPSTARQLEIMRETLLTMPLEERRINLEVFGEDFSDSERKELEASLAGESGKEKDADKKNDGESDKRQEPLEQKPDLNPGRALPGASKETIEEMRLFGEAEKEGLAVKAEEIRAQAERARERKGARVRRLIIEVASDEHAEEIFKMFVGKGIIEESEHKNLFDEREFTIHSLLVSEETRVGYAYDFDEVAWRMERVEEMIMDAASDTTAQVLFEFFQRQGLLTQEQFEEIMEERMEDAGPEIVGRRFVAGAEGRAEEVLTFPAREEGWYQRAASDILQRRLRKIRAEDAFLEEVLDQKDRDFLAETVRFIMDFDIKDPKILALVKEQNSEVIQMVLKEYQRNLVDQEAGLIDVLKAEDPKVEFVKNLLEDKIPLSKEEIVDLLAEITREEVRLQWEQIMGEPAEGPVAEWFRRQLQVQKKMRTEAPEYLKRSAGEYQRRKRRKKEASVGERMF